MLGECQVNYIMDAVKIYQCSSGANVVAAIGKDVVYLAKSGLLNKALSLLN